MFFDTGISQYNPMIYSVSLRYPIVPSTANGVDVFCWIRNPIAQGLKAFEVGGKQGTS